MSEEMAVKDGSSSDEVKLNGEEGDGTAPAAAAEANADVPTQDPEVPAEESPSEATAPESLPSSSAEPTQDAQEDADLKPVTDRLQALKRRASSVFSEEGADDFKGFDQSNLDDSTVEYNRVLERIESEVSAARQSVTPLRNVTAIISSRANKKMRQDPGTDSSRPSSGMSFRSDGEGLGSDLLVPTHSLPLMLSTDHTFVAHLRSGASPLPRRRPTVELSSPLLRVPLDKGWKRELVHRANLDAYNRKVADIYYYTPTGKKLRSTREIAEHLSGTGLTLENFSFFKEPLGVDDPEKEIIRDAKLMRRTESPVPPPAEGKRAPKPKAPKGASPDRGAAKSPPGKIKVKSVGSRLSTGSAGKVQPPKKTAADNNNTAVPKKASPPRAAWPANSRELNAGKQPGQGGAQPCSISCGGGAVPTLSCGACLCLYHPHCANYDSSSKEPFLCKNCAPPAPPRAPAKAPQHNKSVVRMPPPQALARVNGRRFIVVPRSVAS